MAVDSGIRLFNDLKEEECIDAVIKCCGSLRFSKALTSARPFLKFESLDDVARGIWWNDVDIHGWFDAFSAHPRIGDIEGLRSKFKSTSNFTEGEQSAALQSSNEEILKELLEWNLKYENKFGHVFLICATGKSSQQILSSIKERYPNQPIVEIQLAAKEQEKITTIRLTKLLMELCDRVAAAEGCKGFTKAETRLGNITAHLSQQSQLKVKQSQSVQKLRPPITTHVLDVTLGKPALGLPVILKKMIKINQSQTKSMVKMDPAWQQIGDSLTDSDGRSGMLMEPSDTVDPGTYELTFFIKEYFWKVHGKNGFYPHVSIVFDIFENQTHDHFHVPLLLSPFAFNTYRGS